MRVHRLIAILMKIEQYGRIKANYLAKALEVSPRTIYRDIDVLCEAGYPIVTTTGKDGGIAFVDGYKLNLDQTEDTMKTLLTHLYAMPEQEHLIDALVSGMNVKYNSINTVRDEDRQKILIDRKAWWEETQTDIDIQPIMKALFSQQKLSFEYANNDGTKSDRIIAPYGLVLKYTTWYLVGFCYNRQQIRTFNCSRIKCVALLKESIVIPEDFKLKNYWSYSTKAFKESRRESEYYPVEIKVHESFGAVFQNFDLIGIKIDGDYIIGLINLHRKDVAQIDIRAILCYGEILYPEEMRIKASEILKNSINRYHN